MVTIKSKLTRKRKQSTSAVLKEEEVLVEKVLDVTKEEDESDTNLYMVIVDLRRKNVSSMITSKRAG